MAPAHELRPSRGVTSTFFFAMPRNADPFVWNTDLGLLRIILDLFCASVRNLDRIAFDRCDTTSQLRRWRGTSGTRRSTEQRTSAPFFSQPRRRLPLLGRVPAEALAPKTCSMPGTRTSAFWRLLRGSWCAPRIRYHPLGRCAVEATATPCGCVPAETMAPKNCTTPGTRTSDFGSSVRLQGNAFDSGSGAVCCRFLLDLCRRTTVIYSGCALLTQALTRSAIVIYSGARGWVFAVAEPGRSRDH